MPREENGLWLSVKGFITFMGSIAVTVAAVYGALYLFVPSLEPREQLGTEITQVAVTHDVSYRMYNGEDASKEEPQGVGVEILVAADLRAYKTRSYNVRVKLLDAKEYTQIHVGVDQPFVSTCRFKSPAAEEDSVVWRCWALAPRPGVEYIVRAEIYDGGPSKGLETRESDPTEEPIAFFDSKVFIMPDV